MFGWFKRKCRKVYAPVDGQTIDIAEVPDEVFAQKMAGEGVAIRPASELFCAPIGGIVKKIFPTNHAYIVDDGKGLSVTVHIGLETVGLKGKGFERLAQEGDAVSAGDPIVRADLNYLAQEGIDTVTPVVLSEDSDRKGTEKFLRIVKRGDEIMEVC